MQTLDDREARIRNSFKRLEDEYGFIEKEVIINLLTVKRLNRERNKYFIGQTFADKGRHETLSE